MRVESNFKPHDQANSEPHTKAWPIFALQPSCFQRTRMCTAPAPLDFSSSSSTHSSSSQLRLTGAFSKCSESGSPVCASLSQYRTSESGCLLCILLVACHISQRLLVVVCGCVTRYYTRNEPLNEPGALAGTGVATMHKDIRCACNPSPVIHSPRVWYPGTHTPK